MKSFFLSFIREKEAAAFLAVAWMAVIFMLSSFPGSPVKYEMPILLYMERKGAHVFEFFLLSLLAWNALRLFLPREKNGFVILLSATISLSYAVLDETHQIFVPGREGKVTDILFDGTGIFLGMLLVVFFRKKFLKKKRKTSAS